jgi:hypothetical protein
MKSTTRMSTPITKTQCAWKARGNREGAEDTSSPSGLSMFFSATREAIGDLEQK